MPTWMEEASPELTVDLVEVVRGVVSVEVSGPRAVPDPEPLAKELEVRLGEPVDVQVTLTPTQLAPYDQDAGTTFIPEGGTVTGAGTASPEPTASTPGAPG